MDRPGRIAVLGSGPIGRHLAALFQGKGYDVVVGVRDPGKHTVACVPWRQAVERAGVVVLAVPYKAVGDIAANWPADGADRIVVAPANPVALSPDGHIVTGLDGSDTVGSRLAKLFPATPVVRAFTHVMDELLGERGVRQPGLWAMAIAGDDSAAKETTAGLVTATGFVPVDIGGLADSAPLDPGGVLFPQMFTVAGMKRRLLEGA